jgi:hypothetical protein
MSRTDKVVREKGGLGWQAIEELEELKPLLSSQLSQLTTLTAHLCDSMLCKPAMYMTDINKDKHCSRY